MKLSKIETTFNRVFAVFKAVQIICLIVISTLMFSQVILREVFNVGSQWIFEMCTFLQVTMLWFGVPILLYRDEDIRITVIYEKMPPSIKQALDWFSFMIIVASAGMLTWGYVLYLQMIAFSKSPVLRLPNYIYFGSLSIGIVFICLVLIFKAIQKIRKLHGSSPVPM